MSKRNVLYSITLIFTFLCTGCNHNSIQSHGEDTWFVKFQTGVLSGICYHMYNDKVQTNNGTLTLQNRSLLPVTISLSDHSITRKRVFSKELLPGQMVKCENLNIGTQYCVSLTIIDDKGSKNGIVAVYATDEIIPFNYMQALEEQHNILLDAYNKIFEDFRYY